MQQTAGFRRLYRIEQCAAVRQRKSAIPFWAREMVRFQSQLGNWNWDRSDFSVLIFLLKNQHNTS
tara:strand:- start:592 stop:786 length:195 start_codon:yes stop_codon:yes gene_type:complete